MKKQLLVVLAALVAVFVCLGVAIDKSHNLKVASAASQSSQVQKLQNQIKKDEAQQRLHDQVYQADLKNYADRILSLKQQKVTLCAQLKAARLVQPICQ